MATKEMFMFIAIYVRINYRLSTEVKHMLNLYVEIPIAIFIIIY